MRLLNAARQGGLAARTRASLQRSGWRQVAIGDAAKVRRDSLVLYSERDEAAARRLAAYLRLPLAAEPRPGSITVLLGMDIAARGARRS